MRSIKGEKILCRTVSVVLVCFSQIATRKVSIDPAKYHTLDLMWPHKFNLDWKTIRKGELHCNGCDTRFTNG